MTDQESKKPADPAVLDELESLDPAELDKLPEEQKKRLLFQVKQHVETRSFATQIPIPPPELLREWAELIPDAPERIMVQFETQSRHRRELEAEVVRSEIERTKRGQVFAFVTIAPVAIGGVGAVLLGYSVSGLAALMTACATVVATFVLGRKRKESVHEQQRPKKE